MLLGKPLSYKDLQDLDVRLFSSIEQVITDDVTGWGLSFSVDVDRYGVVESIDLIPGGKNVDVNQDNKREYVRFNFYLLADCLLISTYTRMSNLS